MRNSATCLMAGIAMASIAYALAAPPSPDEKTPPEVYRVMPRLEIDKLGLDGKLPPNHSYEPSLERGLNILAAQGWEFGCGGRGADADL